MNCKNCNKEREITNKHFNLCHECNQERLHGSKYGKQYKYIKKPRKFLRSAQNNFKKPDTTKSKVGKNKKSLFSPIIKPKNRIKTTLELDEEFYEKCFNNSDHKCEECDCDLPTVFRNEESKIVARWRYSHIIPKSIAPELRHKIKNINHLCLEDHSEWEFGDKRKMKIYNENCKKFPRYF